LIGSCYGTARLYRSNKNFVEAPATLNESSPTKDKQDEVSRFSNFISRFDQSLGKRAKEWIREGSNRFLVALYRLLPSTRSQIRLGLTDEVNFAEQEIGTASQGKTVVRKTAFANAFLRAGMITEEHLFSLETKEEIAGENINQLSKLIRLVIVPGRFGHKVPLEILMRTIGKEGVSNFANLLDKVNTDIIQWYEDENGSIEIGARHQLEAQQITQSLLGDAKAEVEYAEKLLLNIRENGNFNSDAEIEFAIKLVVSMGPNGTDANHFANYFQKISEILTKLREEQSIQNTSLMLQEAFLLRETIINRIQRQIPLATHDAEEILEKSENILRQAIDLLEINSRNKGKRSRLMVELASVLGTKSRYLLESQNDISRSIRFLHEAQKTAFEAFALVPDSYYSIDVIGWTSDFILRTSDLDLKSRYEIEANIYHAFTLAEAGDLSAKDSERFQRHRMSIGKLTKDDKISEDAFQRLIKLGSSAGYYLKAYEIVREILFKETALYLNEIKLAKNAVQYLQEHRKKINYDARTLFLLLKVWWLSKTGKRLFCGERETLPFNREDWLECLEIVESLMKTSDFYENPSLTYLKGLSTFHLDQVQQSLTIFKELENLVDIKGRRRIIRSYIASNSDGQPKKYTGEVAWIHNNSNEIGKVYVSELQRSLINFMPNIFQRPDIRKGESLGEFHLAFNFLGPIADPIAYYEKYQEKRK
jgi:hypothetical protein